MTPRFEVRTTPHFERSVRKLLKSHPDLVGHVREAVSILAADLYNRERKAAILKLEGFAKDEGQYRLRLRRFRFIYDVHGRDVVLHLCSLRRESTYR